MNIFQLAKTKVKSQSILLFMATVVLLKLFLIFTFIVAEAKSSGFDYKRYF